MKFFAVIVAGGSGTRMNSEIPKQFLLLNGKPVIMHTISAFSALLEKPEIIVVLNQNQFSYWKSLCELHQFDIKHQLVAGGETRFHSVKNALAQINEAAVVAIHDAVRPLIAGEIISNAYQQALKTGNAVVAVPSKDSVRWQKANGETQNLSRNEVFLVQTPQTFHLDILKKAYQQSYSDDFTDDSSVVERSGEKINLIEGNSKNFKITFPSDLLIAEMLLNTKSR